nr:hypothetical protein [Cohnella nanjingensis]
MRPVLRGFETVQDEPQHPSGFGRPASPAIRAALRICGASVSSPRQRSSIVSMQAGVVSRWNCRPSTRLPQANAWTSVASDSASRTAPSGSETASLCQWNEWNFSGSPSKRRVAFRRPAHRMPADLLVRVAEDASAERLGQELRAEADAQHPDAFADRGSNEALLLGQPVVLAFQIHALRTAQNHEHPDIADLGIRLAVGRTVRLLSENVQPRFSLA